MPVCVTVTGDGAARFRDAADAAAGGAASARPAQAALAHVRLGAAQNAAAPALRGLPQVSVLQLERIQDWGKGQQQYERVRADPHVHILMPTTHLRLHMRRKITRAKQFEGVGVGGATLVCLLFVNQTEAQFCSWKTVPPLRKRFYCQRVAGISTSFHKIICFSGTLKDFTPTIQTSATGRDNSPPPRKIRFLTR